MQQALRIVLKTVPGGAFSGLSPPQMLELSLLGVGTVPRLERDAWSMVND